MKLSNILLISFLAASTTTTAQNTTPTNAPKRRNADHGLPPPKAITLTKGSAPLFLTPPDGPSFSRPKIVGTVSEVAGLTVTGPPHPPPSSDTPHNSVVSEVIGIIISLDRNTSSATQVTSIATVTSTQTSTVTATPAPEKKKGLSSILIGVIAGVAELIWTVAICFLGFFMGERKERRMHAKHNGGPDGPIGMRDIEQNREENEERDITEEIQRNRAKALSALEGDDNGGLEDVMPYLQRKDVWEQQKNRP
jgi:hypothetical protein